MSRNVNVDFTGVEAGFSRVRIPEGDYGFKISKVVSKKASTGTPMLVFGLKVIKGNPAGLNKEIPHNCALSKQSLWNLRNLLEATGKQVPSKALKIDLDKLLNLTLAGTVIDNEYEGKKSSVVSAFFPMADLNPEPEPGTESEEGEEAADGDDSSGDEDATEESSEDEELFG